MVCCLYQQNFVYLLETTWWKHTHRFFANFQKICFTLWWKPGWYLCCLVKCKPQKNNSCSINVLEGSLVCLVNPVYNQGSLTYWLQAWNSLWFSSKGWKSRSSASSYLLLTQAANDIASVGWQFLSMTYWCHFCPLEVGWELLAILILISITKSVSYHENNLKQLI